MQEAEENLQPTASKDMGCHSPNHIGLNFPNKPNKLENRFILKDSKTGGLSIHLGLVNPGAENQLSLES